MALSRPDSLHWGVVNKTNFLLDKCYRYPDAWQLFYNNKYEKKYL